MKHRMLGVPALVHITLAALGMSRAQSVQTPSSQPSSPSHRHNRPGYVRWRVQ